MKRILVIEDEPQMLLGLRDNLELEGYEVQTAADGDEGLARAASFSPDLVILDVMLPKKNGFDVCRELRARSITTPIVMLTARSAETDKVLGLELGADDYLVKPFSPRELVARLRALLRRTAEVATLRAQLAPAAETGDYLVIDSSRRLAHFDDQQLDLRPREFDLLAVLAAYPGQVWSREALLKRVWGTDEHIDARTVDVHIRRLRAKLTAINATSDPIQTEWGVGYRYVPDAGGGSTS